MDNYYEQTVARAPRKNDTLYEVLVWLGAVAMTGLTFYVTIILLRNEKGLTTWWPVFLLAGILYFMLAALFSKRLRSEYEYDFSDGELEVARILSKGSRKTLSKMTFGQLIAFGRYNKDVRKKHNPYNVFSAYTDDSGELWYGVYLDNGRKKMVVFEPDETLLGLIKAALPRELRAAAFDYGER